VRASGGLFRSECPFVVTLGTTLYAGFPVEWIPGIEEVPGHIETIPPFGAGLSAVWLRRFTRVFAFAVHSHLLGAVAAFGWQLIPVLSLHSNERLPRAHRRTMLSLLHLEGRGFTCLDIQLSKNTLFAAFLCAFDAISGKRLALLFDSR